MTINTLLIKKNESCGISFFNSNLKKALDENFITVNELCLSKSLNLKNNVTIFHYVPSMYVNYTEEIVNLFKSNVDIISIIHGVYPNKQFNHLGDTVNQNQRKHIEIISSSSKAIIFLSKSSNMSFKSWFPEKDFKNHFIYIHPGFSQQNKFIKVNKTNADYVFIGGITRPKKDFKTKPIINLLLSLKDFGIKVWLHSSNAKISIETEKLVWKTSSGKLSNVKWKEIIFNSRFVLCPYSTEIQTVSGIISESLSLGKRIISTSFPYALELKNDYDKYIIIENNFNIWAKIIKRVWDEQPEPNKFYNWDNFRDDITNIIKNVCQQHV